MEFRWMLIIHWLGNFLIFGPGASVTHNCTLPLKGKEKSCARLRIPIAHHKTEGATCRLTFLRIQLDSGSGTLCFSGAKRQWLYSEIRLWVGRSLCTNRKLFFLIGQLQHTCSIKTCSIKMMAGTSLDYDTTVTLDQMAKVAGGGKHSLH